MTAKQDITEIWCIFGSLKGADEHSERGVARAYSS